VSYISNKTTSGFVINHVNAQGNELASYIMINDTSGAVKTGSGTLENGTSTVIYDANVNVDSKIFLQATSPGTFEKFPGIINKSNGSFEIAHGSASGIETFDYAIFNMESGTDGICLGSDTLTIGTSTTVTDPLLPCGTMVFLQATCALFNIYWKLYNTGIDSIILSTSAAAGTETFDYISFPRDVICFPSLSPSLSPSSSLSPSLPSPSLLSPSPFPDILSRGTCVLSAATSTTVYDENVSPTSIIITLKSDNNQAAYLLCVSSKSNGSFVITHNQGQGNELINYIVLNGSNEMIGASSGTLNAGTSTTINHPLVNPYTKIFLQATGSTCNTFMRWPRVFNQMGSYFTIGHENAAGIETFDYAIFRIDIDTYDGIYLGSGELSIPPATDTTIMNAGVTANSTILLQSTNAQMYGGNPTYAYWRIKTKSEGSFVIASNFVDHASFSYAVINGGAPIPSASPSPSPSPLSSPSPE
jgi:hypothetical protein